MSQNMDHDKSFNLESPESTVYEPQRKESQTGKRNLLQWCAHPPLPPSPMPSVAPATRVGNCLQEIFDHDRVGFACCICRTSYVDFVPLMPAGMMC